MRKFNLVFIFILTVFIVFGLIGVFVNDNDEDSVSPDLPNSMVMANTPGYTTMMTVAAIVEEEISEDAILDLQVSPEGEEEHVYLILQSNDILTEENLLKQTYPILLQSSKIENITSFTVNWKLNDNLTVMSFKVNQTDLSNMMLENYATIPSIAENYYKHESMN